MKKKEKKTAGAKSAAVTFDELASFLRERRWFAPGRAATEARIRAAERALRVAIVGDYRLFLRTFGWAELQFDSLFGLGVGVPMHLDLVHMTRSERTEMHPRLPHYLLPLMNDGAGNHYCLDCSAADVAHPAILFWDHDLGEEQEPEVHAANFTSWLAAHVEMPR